MGGEMNGAIKTWMKSPGQVKRELLLSLATRINFRATRPAAGKQPCCLGWSADIAAKFEPRNGQQRFARVRLTDFVGRARVRFEKKTFVGGPLFDQRRWVLNEFRNVVLRQQFVTQPMTLKTTISARNAQPRRDEHSRALAGVTELQSKGSSPIVAKSLLTKLSGAGGEKAFGEFELTIAAASGMKRRGGAVRLISGQEANEEARIELPVAKLAKRYRRIEAPREALTKELALRFMMERVPPTAIEMQTTRATPIRSEGLRSAFDDGWIATASSYGINVSQVADEVMKKLDRKLIAARERMGKI
jgi:hypothetical protein